MTLTNSQVELALPRQDKPYKLADSLGMYLLVQPTGAKYWRMNYRFSAKKKTLALGVYPSVSLDEARTRCQEARKLLADSIDPSAAKQEARTKRQAQTNPTFLLLMDGDALTIKTPKATIALTKDQTTAMRAFLIASTNEVSHG